MGIHQSTEPRGVRQYEKIINDVCINYKSSEWHFKMNIDFYIPGGGASLSCMQILILSCSVIIRAGGLDQDWTPLLWFPLCDCSGSAGSLVDKYPPIPGQFVVGCKNCSCFITRIMNRERATDFSSYFLLQLQNK